VNASIRKPPIPHCHRLRSAVASYFEHDLQMVDKLDGILALCIYDARMSGRPSGVERGDLFIARDQLGVRPLYHTTVKEGFLFASSCDRAV
jgi:asparagine synthetase B (glutamine-hydrolysing)